MKFIVQQPQNTKNLPTNIQEGSPPGNDNLIAKGLQTSQYIGLAGLAITLVALVGIVSRRFEYAILFALFLSGILIALFLFV